MDAAIIEVYYHGVAGDFAAKGKGFAALIASDIIEYLKIPLLRLSIILLPTITEDVNLIIS